MIEVTRDKRIVSVKFTGCEHGGTTWVHTIRYEAANEYMATCVRDDVKACIKRLDDAEFLNEVLGKNRMLRSRIGALKGVITKMKRKK